MPRGAFGEATPLGKELAGILQGWPLLEDTVTPRWRSDSLRQGPEAGGRGAVWIQRAGLSVLRQVL